MYRLGALNLFISQFKLDFFQYIKFSTYVLKHAGIYHIHVCSMQSFFFFFTQINAVQLN